MRRALLLFTKVPRPGRVKTRLTGAAGLAVDDASNLYSAILRDIFDIMRRLARSVGIRLYVCYSPQNESEAMKQILCDNGGKHVEASFVPQTEEATTAQRIALAFDALFRGGSDVAVMVFGDQPELDEDLLVEAFRNLEDAEARHEQSLVLGPTCDGGTYLIGLTSGLSGWLHDSIDCADSSKAVSKLVVKAHASNLRIALLGVRNDLDDIDDLSLLRSNPPRNYPHTRDVLGTVPLTLPRINANTITVIIPTLNEEKTLEATILSIRAQQHCGEIVVVDGGSTDGTLDVANRYADRVVPANRPGRQHQENIGAKGAKGDTLLFLHADTVVPPTLLQSITTSLQDPTIVAGGAHLVYSPPDRFRYRALSVLRDIGGKVLGVHGMGSAFFIRRGTFRTLGGFDEEMNEEAVDMCKRLRGLGRHVTLDEVVRSSARRYERSGFVRTNLAWALTIALSYVGIRAVIVERYIWRVVR